MNSDKKKESKETIIHKLLFELRDSKHNQSTKMDLQNLLKKTDHTIDEEEKKIFSSTEKLPCVVYGSFEGKNISLNLFLCKRTIQYQHDKHKHDLIRHRFHFVSNSDHSKGLAFEAMIQDVQYAISSHQMIHLDFLIAS